MTTQEFIRLTSAAKFDDEEQQWKSDEYNKFRHPPHFKLEVDDPQLCLSLKIYFSLSRNLPEHCYEEIQQSIIECYPDCQMLSFDQVCSRLWSMMGIMPLYFDMCVEACMAFTGAFCKLLKCIFREEDHYKSVAHSDKPSSTPCHQSVTLPIGPQLQALWHYPRTVANIHDRLHRTEKYLDKGIDAYHDVLCGSEYLDLVRQGHIGKDDMIVVQSVDKAQIYKN